MTVAVIENDALPKGYFTYRYQVLLRNLTCQFLKSPNHRNSQELTEVGMGEEVEDEDVIKISLSHCQLWPSKLIKSLFFCLSLFLIWPPCISLCISLTLFSLRRQHGILERVRTLVTD